jgi:hypothetical protein
MCCAAVVLLQQSWGLVIFCRFKADERRIATYQGEVECLMTTVLCRISQGLQLCAYFEKLCIILLHAWQTVNRTQV